MVDTTKLWPTPELISVAANSLLKPKSIPVVAKDISMGADWFLSLNDWYYDGQGLLTIVEWAGGIFMADPFVRAARFDGYNNGDDTLEKGDHYGVWDNSKRSTGLLGFGNKLMDSDGLNVLNTAFLSLKNWSIWSHQDVNPWSNKRNEAFSRGSLYGLGAALVAAEGYKWRVYHLLDGVPKQFDTMLVEGWCTPWAIFFCDKIETREQALCAATLATHGAFVISGDKPFYADAARFGVFAYCAKDVGKKWALSFQGGDISTFCNGSLDGLPEGKIILPELKGYGMLKAVGNNPRPKKLYPLTQPEGPSLPLPYYRFFAMGNTKSDADISDQYIEVQRALLQSLREGHLLCYVPTSHLNMWVDFHDLGVPAMSQGDSGKIVEKTVSFPVGTNFMRR